MANPARKYDERPELDPRAADPHNPASPMDADPVARDPRIAANDPFVNNNVVERGTGNGVIIAAVLLVLAVVAFFIFGPGVGDDTTVIDQPVTVEPAAPAPDATAPAPDATAPAAPADPATPAPDATAPEAPADTTAPAPDATAPADAPTDAAPAEPAPAPAEPAPAQ